MKILVTGGAGFIGSHVIRLALKQGHSIVNCDSLTYAACLENLSDVENNPKYTFEQCDILDRDRLKTIFKNHIPDAVMHLAAESHVDRSIEGPAKFIQTNVNGTFNMLQEALAFWRAQGKPEEFRFHHVSTDEVFGSLGKIGAFSEDTPYDPRSPYSASKASSDHLVRAWHETYSLPTIITNCSNNYGPFHFPEKLIPLMILNALAGKALPIYGTGMNIRDWLFVEDHAQALLLVIEKGLPGRNYNIGGENERTNIDLVTELCEILDRLKPRQSGSYSELITFVSDRPGHDQRYAIDPTRIRSELGWTPSTSLEKGLEITVKWYLANEDWWRPLLSRSLVENRLGLREID